MAKFPVSLKARLLLIDRGKILLLEQTKPNGGNFTMVGGTIEAKEFAKTTLIRESFEEAGVVLKKEDLQLIHVLHKRSKKAHRIVLYFKAHNWKGHLESKEQKKFKSADWHNVNDLPDKLTGTVKQVIKCYRQGKLYSEMEK
ncbi:NUDIX hydrolase [Lewinellaceae bacterium SD302]|nr:NUDIX hydrolase [Lewinellaceae bacterium SD302]